MAINMNHIFIGGNISSAPRKSTTKNGKEYFTFMVASNRGKDKNGKEAADFIPIRVSGAMSPFMEQNITVGAPIMLNGDLENRSYESDGKSKRYFTVNARDIIPGTGSNVNLVYLMGNVTRDPELRQSADGTSVTTLAIAVNRSYRDANNEWKTVASYFDITCWDKQAEFVCQHFHKSSPVTVIGSIRSRSYKDKTTGENRTSYEIAARNIRFVNKRKEGTENGNTSAPAPAAQQNSYSVPEEDFAMIEDEGDIPF